jgi:hypothetical protein
MKAQRWLSGSLGALGLGLLLGVAGGCGSAPVDVLAVDSDIFRDRLVAYWNFDEDAGTQVTDRSGSHHDGVLNGGSWIPGGKFKGALELASGQFVSVADFPPAANSWTVSVWIKAADTVDRSVDQRTIISTETVYTGGWQIYLDNRTAFGQFKAAYWAGPGQNDYTWVDCDCVKANVWTHLTAVWDGAMAEPELRLYQDGDRVDHEQMPFPIKPGDATLLMGMWNMNNRFFDGAIDDIAIWSRVLEPTEIALLSRRPPI